MANLPVVVDTASASVWHSLAMRGKEYPDGLSESWNRSRVSGQAGESGGLKRTDKLLTIIIGLREKK